VPSLYRHPDTPPGAVRSIEAELERTQGGAFAIFRVRGEIAQLNLPKAATPKRADDLWQNTCFELFVTNGATG
jgi:hypothetical protein